MSDSPAPPSADALLETWRRRGSRRPAFEALEAKSPGGCEVFVIEEGEAGPRPDLVVLHGFPTSSLDFRHVLGRWAEGRRIIVHDHLGFGFSDKPADYSYSLFEQAEVALDLWRRLGVERAHLLAHDYGTSVATEILARRERFGLDLDLRSVTLSNGSFFLHLAKPRLAQKISRSKLLGPLFGRLVNEAYFTRVIRGLWGQGERFEAVEAAAMWRGLRLADGHLRNHQISSYLGERERFLHRWRGALERLDVPCHALWGRRDPVALPAVAEHLLELAPEAEATWLEDAGHFPMLEVPEAFGDAALDFWRRVESRDEGA